MGTEEAGDEHEVSTTRPRFARLPEEVFDDPELTRADLRVYCRMASHCINTNIFQFGQRWLSQELGMDRRNVVRSLNKLASRGHISTAIGYFSGRRVYQINSQIFLATAERVASTLTPPLASPVTPHYRKRGTDAQKRPRVVPIRKARSA